MAASSEASRSAEPLVLASASPRRRELLARVGLEVEVVPAAIDEPLFAGEDPEAAALRLAGAKAAAVARARPGRFVLAADTVVAVAGEALGKPADRDEAAAMLGRLLGRAHRVTTAVCLACPGGESRRRAVTTEVIMRRAAAAEVAGYLDSGEWAGKAGGYAIQGIAAALVREVRGSVTNVVGLPLAETLELLAEAGGPEPRFGAGRPA